MTDGHGASGRRRVRRCASMGSGSYLQLFGAPPLSAPEAALDEGYDSAKLSRLLG